MPHLTKVPLSPSDFPDTCFCLTAGIHTSHRPVACADTVGLMGVKSSSAFSKESGMANYSCGQMHKWKEPAGGTVEYKAWWLPIRQKEAVCVVPWWFQF